MDDPRAEPVDADDTGATALVMVEIEGERADTCALGGTECWAGGDEA